jgi:choline dehydrogenase-like flavoprotein
VTPAGDGRISTEPVWAEPGWEPLPPLTGSARADVCVVGLGVAGLTAARTLAEHGRSVIAVDATGVAAGASGRNGGFLLAGLAAFHHDAAAALGRETAAALYRATLDELMVVHEVSPPRQLRRDRDHPCARDDPQQDRGGEAPPPCGGRGARSDGAGGCAHAVCSIFQSAWIALRPSWLHSIPYWGRLTDWRVAFPTYAGDPGTVEKTDSRRVVALPSGPV